MSVIGQSAGIEHGTMKGYKQHRYRKVESCDACLAAVREYNALKRAEREAKPVERSQAQRAWYGGQFQHDASTTPRRGRRKQPDGLPELPESGRPEWGQPIHGQDLAVGDVLVHLGEHHVIDRFEPYKGSLRGVLGAGARTAWSGNWGITVGPHAIMRILPRAGDQ
ncbi:hypothetical protein ACIBG7_18790 [Nonomuraea sp. NPDC050328]|uniref:hypothetical protein n=1 Tax=Nonomuraea sp. NPDC050328 TaxID=3364361 RepID=UPI0037BCD9E0